MTSRPSPIFTQDLGVVDKQSLGSSTRSSTSTLSFQDKLCGLLSPSSSTEATDVLNEDEYQTKVETIQNCLRGINGSSTNDVDLWRLRELALQPGGLLEPSLRKRAWPLLTGMTFVQQTKPSSTVTPSHKDIVALQREVPHMVWNVQEHFVQLQHKQKQLQLHVENERANTMSKRVSFAGEANTLHVENAEESSSNGSADFSFSSRSSGNRRRIGNGKARKMEQTIVMNAITSCLQAQPAASESFVDSRHHYFTGLHDLTALLMINLESPSLSSLLL